MTTAVPAFGAGACTDVDHADLLDEQRHAWWDSLRIVRIAPDTGVATVLARTPYFRHHDALYRSATDPGELVVAASASRPGTTLLMTLEPRDSNVRLTGWLVKQGTLVAPPDTRGDSGYSVVLQRRRHGPVEALEIAGSDLHRQRQGRDFPGWCD